MDRNIVETRVEDPEQVAARIIARGATMWWTECETDGCTNLVGQPRRRYISMDASANATTATILIQYSAPGARLCKECS